MTQNYISHASLDEDIRKKKATKLISVLSSFVNLDQCNILDIGTGSGHIAHELCLVCKSVVSVNLTDERVVRDGYRFIQIKDENLPFLDGTFDVVISNHVIEHVPNQMLHIREVFRVLSKNGVLYLATPNKYAFVEPHFMLPFLSWLPRHAASAWLKYFKNQVWDIYPLSLKEIKKLVSSEFEFTDMSIEVIKNPRKYNLDMCPVFQSLLRLIPVRFLEVLRFIFPSYIIVLRKK
jgi:2-polyprenyl-3-methyl-5-hydroxy-6-metoxy-1,4-benzoquinol methylase